MVLLLRGVPVFWCWVVVGCAHRLIVRPNGGESGTSSARWGNPSDGDGLPTCLEPVRVTVQRLFKPIEDT